MLTQQALLRFLARRRPYPNAPWQRWLGLSGGSRWRHGPHGPSHSNGMRDGLIALWFVCAGFMVHVALDNPWGWAALVGGGLLSAYACIILLSSGVVHKWEMEDLARALNSQPRLAQACAVWMKPGEMIRKRDYFRILFVAWLLPYLPTETSGKERSKEEDTSCVLAQKIIDQVASWQGLAPPLPSDMTSQEVAQIYQKLQTLCIPATRWRRWLPFWRVVLAWSEMTWPASAVCPEPGKRLPYGTMLIQWLGVFLILAWASDTIFPHMGVSLARLGRLYCVSLAMAAVYGPTLLLLWYARTPLDEGLAGRVSAIAAHDPKVAWVLAHRCGEAGKVSRRDLTAALKAQELLKSYEKRKKREKEDQEYQAQFEALPGVAQARAQQEAEQLEQHTDLRPPPQPRPRL